MSTNEQGSAHQPAPPSQAPPLHPPYRQQGWPDILAGHGGNAEAYVRAYAPQPPPYYAPPPVQIDARTTTGLPWYVHMGYAFVSILTCGWGVKWWVKAWARSKRVARTRSV